MTSPAGASSGVRDAGRLNFTPSRVLNGADRSSAVRHLDDALARDAGDAPLFTAVRERLTAWQVAAALGIIGLSLLLNGFEQRARTMEAALHGACVARLIGPAVPGD